MTMTKVHAMTVAATPTPWSGIDAGRREQVGLEFTSLRHFRRSRRSVKPAAGIRADSPQSPDARTFERPRLSHSWPAPLELKGSHAYLRELRRMEMEAWERTGGDVYRPAETSARRRVGAEGNVEAAGEAEALALAEFPNPQ